MCDRGPNLLKALKDYQVLNCFPHRMNNVMKRAFFQLKAKQKPAKITPTIAQETTLLNITKDSYDSSDSNSSTDDEELFKPKKTIKKKRQRKQSTVSNGDDPMKLKFEDLTIKAREIIETITQCKKLVRYIKKVIYFLGLNILKNAAKRSRRYLNAGYFFQRNNFPVLSYVSSFFLRMD